MRSRNVLLLATLAFAGCGSNDAPPSPSTSDQAAREAAPLSEAEYQELLDRASDTVKDAVSQTRRAGSAATTAKKLEASASELQDVAGELEASSAPDGAQQANASAAAALTDLSTEFASTAGEVEAAEFCTAPAALAALTRSDAVRNLRAAAKDLRAEGFKVAGLVPRAQRKPSVKLSNGMVLTRKGGSGSGQLVIRNGGSRDGVVKIVDGGNRTTIHVRRKATTTVTGIPDSTYRVFFASGSSWDGKRNTFSRNCSFSAFDDKMKFTSGGGQYTRYTITLNAVAGGNAQTNPVDPSDFPRD